MRVPQTKYSATLRWVGCALIHAAGVVLPLLLFAGLFTGETTVQDVNTAIAGLALGFIVYFQFMSERTYEPSTLSYLILVSIGLGSVIWVTGYEVGHFSDHFYPTLAAFVRLIVMTLFVLSLELATGDLPPRLMRILPDSLKPTIPQDAFIRKRRTAFTRPPSENGVNPDLVADDDPPSTSRPDDDSGRETHPTRPDRDTRTRGRSTRRDGGRR